MIKLYQFSWLGIKFNQIHLKKSSRFLANEYFYSLFYKNLFKKYKNLYQLPNVWLKHKLNVAKFVQKFCKRKFKKKKIKILSIGCGLGLIENYLYGKGFIITATENQRISTKFLNKKINFIKTDNLKIFNKKKFDAVLVCGIDYVFNNKEYRNFLKEIEGMNFKYLIITDIIIRSKLSVYLNYLKSVVKYLYLGQFWGWIRDENEHIEIFSKTNLYLKNFKKMPNSENYYAVLKK